VVNDTLRYKHGNGMSKVKIGKGTCIPLSTFCGIAFTILI